MMRAKFVMGVVVFCGASLACSGNMTGAPAGAGASAGTGATAGGGSTGAGAGPGAGSGGARVGAGSGGAGGAAGNMAGRSVPGVQVTNGAGAVTCVPLCVQMTDPAADPQGDDYGFEQGSSCIIPHTATATNDPCTTGAPLPPPAPRAGVVVRNAMGNRECVAKCIFYGTPTQKGANGDGFADDWAYENNATCVIPATTTAATSLPCTTGQPVPPDQPRPGVVVLNPVTKALECVSKCTYFTSPTQVGANGDNLGDDWAFEFGGSCIIPGTVTSFNQACTTLQPLPAVEPRPGIMVNADPVVDSCTSSMCVPLCQHVTTGSAAAYPDWGWENNNSCVIPGSPSATTVPKSVENQGYAVAPRSCTWGAPARNFLAPPALDAARTMRPHFLTVGRVLQDPYGQPFLIRGVNNSDGWYDICGQYSAYEGLTGIAAQGANAVRIGWAFKSIDPVGPLMGDPVKPVIGTNAKLLAEILYRIVELKMIPILAINDSTGQTTADWPLMMAQLLAAPDYKAVLLAYEPYLLIGISNEWNGTAADYYMAYNNAVQYLRTNGINHTLVVTGNDWGQGCDSILQNASRLSMSDPLHNILYDVHLYNYVTLAAVAPGHGGTAAFIQGCLDAAATATIPLLIGEFGNTHGGMPVQWQTIVARANANAQGYTPWLWFGDTEFPELNLATKWNGPLTAWGASVLPLVATKASIFP